MKQWVSQTPCVSIHSSHSQNSAVIPQTPNKDCLQKPTSVFNELQHM